jgi:hypothetical protein
MATLINQLCSAEEVDNALLGERHRAVLIHFRRTCDPISAATDVVLHEVAHELRLHCVLYVVDIDSVRDFNAVHELYDPSTLMCFYRNRSLPINVGFGPDARVTWPLCEGAVLVDAIQRACREQCEASRRQSDDLGLGRRLREVWQDLIFGSS